MSNGSQHSDHADDELEPLQMLDLIVSIKRAVS
jgi:hypothetical protein